MNDMHDVWQHPQLKARGRWIRGARRPPGRFPALLPPGDTDAFAPRMDAVPALGQHTEAILRRTRLERRPTSPRCDSAGAV